MAGRRIEYSAVEILHEIPHASNRKYGIGSWLHTARKVNEAEPIYQHILKYINNGQQSRHQQRHRIQVQHILEIRRATDEDYENSPTWQSAERMLLWHVPEPWNLACILRNGFQIPTSNEEMFGAGFYFEDRIVNTSRFSPSRGNETMHENETGFLLLCDVLLGERFHAKHPNKTFSLTRPPNGYRSVMGTGWYEPHPAEEVSYNGSIIPLGRTVEKGFVNGSCDLYYNKYVSYNSEWVKPRYLIKFQNIPL